jgi:nicotinate-nucleotide adenylyltransferase
MQLLIAADPWQKQGVTPLAQRLEMLHAALQEDAVPTLTPLSINTFEIDYVRNHGGPTYSIDTLAALRQQQGDAPMTFVMGWDQWLKLPSWHRWRELTDYAHVCIAPRVNTFGTPSNELLEWSEFKFASAEQLRERPQGRIFQLPLFEQPVSSTLLRGLLNEQKYTEAAPWLHASVLRYIQSHQLYL